MARARRRFSASTTSRPTPSSPPTARLTTPPRWPRWEKLSKQFAEACKTRSAKIYAHIDTESAARDIDVLRAALGDEKLSGSGASYGTFLGATYADLFPTKVGRMVLDGAIDPTLTNVSSPTARPRASRKPRCAASWRTA